LTGLAAVLVGGVGVGNAISSFLAMRLHTIAILKCLGAPKRLVFATYFLQLTALALLGIAVGVAVGAAVPFLAQSLVADLLPVRARVALYAQPLATAAAFGLLVSLLFALLPLIRARGVPAATLMRGAVVEAHTPPLARHAMIAAAALLLAAFTVDRRQPAHAGYFVLGAVGTHRLPLLAHGVRPWPPGSANPNWRSGWPRQSPSSRRADAGRHAVAGPRPHRAGGDG
jgi:putative ABC transport system permease protein